MKMRNLLFGVILGLFAFVHSAPVDTVTTDIYHEVMTDGYLIDNYSTTSLTTQLPTRNATVQESEETDVIEESHLGESNSEGFPEHQGEHYVSVTSGVSDPQSSTTEFPKDTDDLHSDSYATQTPLPDDDQSRESDVSEDIDLGDSNYNSMTSAAPQQEKEHYATTTPSVSDPQSSTSTELSMDSDDTSDSDPTQTSHFTSSSMPNEVMTSISPDSILDFQTTDPSFSTVDLWSLERSEEQSPTTSPSMTSVSNTETSTESSTFTTALKTFPRMFEESEGSGFGFEQETDTTAKMITESNQPQEETSTESSTIMTALETTSRMFEERDGSGFGFEQETTHTTAKMMTESNQPQEETSTEPSTFTTAFEMFPRMSEENEGSGFGFEKENQPQDETSTASSNSMTIRHIAPRIFNELGSGFEQKPKVQEPVSTSEIVETNVNQLAAGPGVGKELVTVRPPAHQNAGHSTPGWIIIVGFIVGVAALVMLCVAIATRDKWNKSKHQPQIETKTSTTNQQRELEMETFLHKDKPTENGKAAEYTVIPLDELPEKYSSH